MFINIQNHLKMDFDFIIVDHLQFNIFKNLNLDLFYFIFMSLYLKFQVFNCHYYYYYNHGFQQFHFFILFTLQQYYFITHFIYILSLHYIWFVLHSNYFLMFHYLKKAFTFLNFEEQQTYSKVLQNGNLLFAILLLIKN